MAYKSEEIESIFESILIKISCGKPVGKILKEKDTPSLMTFYTWLKDPEKSERYAHACEIRAELLFEKMQRIAATPVIGETVTTGTNSKGDIHEVKKEDMLGHRRLQVETLKWVIGKMAPKKFGDTSKHEVINRNFNVDAGTLSPETVKMINDNLESKY